VHVSSILSVKLKLFYMTADHSIENRQISVE
jgi:hypothetical protein